MWKSWVLPQECVCVRVCVLRVKSATTLGKMMFLLNYQITSLPLTLLHLLSFFRSLHHTRSASPPPPSSGFLRAAVRGAESFITHFVPVFFRIPGSSPCPTLVALQKQCIQFVSTREKGCRQLGSPPQKMWSLSFRAFQKISCRYRSAISEAVWTNVVMFFLL